MKANHWRSVAVMLVGALGAAGCSSDSNGPANTAPVAQFTSSCTNLDCDFTDLSSDSDGNVQSYAWEFGDAATATVKTPAHSYLAAGDMAVKLTVTDNDGATAFVTKTVTVTAPPAPGGPTADFSVSCSSLFCTFTDLSSDVAPGSVASWAWDFGDPGSAGSNNSNLPKPVHTYSNAAIATYQAKLTVTDDGGLTSTKSTIFTVSPAATLQCESAPGTGQFASCDLVLTAAAVVTVTLESASCTAVDNTFQITEPTPLVTLFDNGCYFPAAGTSFQLNGGVKYDAGTHLKAQVISGSTKQQIAPALHVEGAYPTWRLLFDDGQDGTPPEPDFNDLVITVTATP